MSKPKQTKTVRLQAMLMRPTGTSLAAICKTTGWQAHSARAALSGLRKSGHVIERTVSPDKAVGSVYRIVPGLDVAQ